MKDLYSRLVGFCLLVTTPAFANSIVINEIMYHSAPAVPEDIGLEWIELHNTSASPVNLKGWQFSRGVSFTFSNDTIVAAGGYLIVAADPAKFAAVHSGLSAITVGPWQGTLGNNGEDIEIENPAGGREDLVTYSQEGDWGTRRRGPLDRNSRGWEWFADHDGLGKSIERINPLVVVDSGQNWATSIPLNGTPGAANSVRSGNIAPMILELQHFPAVPKSTDPVTISARLVDEQTNGLSVTLFHRNASTLGPPNFSSTSMFDDGLHNDGVAGDGIYGAVLLPEGNRTVIEFYASATDGVASRTWPAAALDEFGNSVQAANALYQVDDSVYSGPPQPICRLVMTETERAELQNINRQSDAEMNATFISTDGVEPRIRYNIGMRIRGAGSRSASVPNYRVNIPGDRRWNGVTEINLNAQYGFNQIVGSAVLQQSGIVAADARAVQVRVNGVNLASGGLPQYGTYALVEVINGDWADNHLPLDSGGNVYRGSTGNHSATLSYLGTNPTTYVNAGYSKTSNGSQNDWTDLFQLTETLSNASDGTYVNRVAQVANVDLWMRYFALYTVLTSMETSLATGRGDDYAMYRGINDTRFMIVPHDLDTILGQGDTAGNINANIFRMCPVVNNGANTVVLNRFMTNAAHVPAYYRELKRLMDTTCSPSQLDPLIDHLLGGWVPAQTIAAMKQFSVNRNNYLRSQMPANISINATLPVASGYFQSTTPTVTLSGRANVVETRSIRVNGTLANWIAWQGNWDISNLPLNPGLNRVLVQAFDANGREFERATVDIWYDDGTLSDVSGSISANTIWAPAQGPYRVTANLTVASGATLTIQPGTTVYLNSGVNLIVANGGRLLAEGTDTDRIRFSRTPGTGASWGGLTINGGAGSPETRIAFAHLEFNGDTAIHSTDGTLFLDHLTFGNPSQQYVSLDRSSFVVQDCVFPAITGSFEPVHGSGGIKAGGRGIFLRNFWGKVQGYNDALDFTGGNRPGPILQVINNVFAGSDDDLLDLDSTDAWVEGNIFLHTHRNGSPDSASAVSGGADNADTSQITIVGNLFYDVDHAANAKQGNFYTMINNTVVRQSRVGSQDATAAVVILADDGTPQGAGIYLEGNIFHDIEALTRNQTTALVTFTNNLMPLAWSGPGGANSTNAPRLKYIPQLSETTGFTTWAQAQIFRDWFSLLSGSPAHGAGPNGRDQGGVIPLGASIRGEPDSVTSRNSATLTVGFNLTGNGIPTAGFPNGSGYTHYRWRLDGGTWSSEIPIATPIALSGLANGPHYVEVSGRRDADWYQDDTIFGSDAAVTRSRTWTVNTALSGLRINEVLARNDAVPVGGELPDLVELYNSGNASVDLSGMGLTDNSATPFKFTFPAGTSLGAGEYLVLYADSESAPSGFHLGFALDQLGDSLHLFGKPSTGTNLIDSIVFGLQLPDRSIGRQSDGSWALNVPSFGSANVAHPVGETRTLRINEWLASAGTLVAEDALEIYNPDPLPVDMGGLFLTDDPNGEPARHRIVALSFVAGGAHPVFTADGEPALGANHLNFRLSPEQGMIGLLDQGTNLIDSVIYGPQITDVTEGRRPSGATLIGSINPPTLGGPNPGSGPIITISNITVSLLPINASWRFERSGNDLGTAWRERNFNDSSWSTGTAPLGVEPDNIPVPVATVFSSYNNTQIPYYFRTRFVVNTNLAGFNLNLTVELDDGAVLYLNGQYLTRIRMPDDPIFANTLPNGTVGNATIESVPVPGTALLQGTNVLAVEVHNAANPNSSDIVWATSVEAVRAVTNITFTTLVINEVMANNRSIVNLGDTNVTDWIELYNPSVAAANLGGMSLSDDAANPTRWVFPPGTTLRSGEYLVVRFDPGSPATTANGSVLNTGFGLGANGDEVRLFDTPARGGAELDSVVFGLQAPDFSIGRVPNASGSWKLNLPTQGGANIAASLGEVSALRINEWMANPAGNDDDYFELFNPNPQPVDLSGLLLADNLEFPPQQPHVIAPLSFIGIGRDAFALFIADGDVENGKNHVGFGLSGGGEAIGLFTSGGTRLDGVTFGAQLDGVSEGRFPDGSTTIVKFPGSPTPGESNLRTLRDVAISEVLTHTDLPFEDAIELRNLTVTAVDLSGWFLTDNENDPKRFRIPDGTILEPYGSLVFYEYQINPDFTGLPPYFSLSSSQGDEVFLFTADQNGNLSGFRTGVSFGAAESAVSFGQHLTSVGPDFTALSARTFGADNPTTVQEFRSGTGGTNAYPLVGPVVIHEIMYHPPDIIAAGVTNDNDMDEFIELRNLSALPIPLFHPDFPTNTWRLRDAVDFDFPEGVTLAAGGYFLVVGFDPSTNGVTTQAFRDKYGIAGAISIFGPWQGRLANGDENVELYKPDAPEPQGTPDAGFVPYVQVDKVRYADSAPWPSLADGNTNGVGMSLQRRVAANYGNDPANWIAGVPTPGGATGPGGVTPPTITTITADHLVVPGASDTMTVSATGNAPLSYQWRFNGELISGVTAPSITIPGFQAANAGVYSVVVMNAAGAASASTRADLQSLPVIVRQPQDRVGAFGGSVVFSVLARGTPPLSYQWRKGGVDIAGASKAALTLTNLQTSDISTYSVVIANVFGTATSSGASLSLLTPPTLVTQPQSTNVFVGGQFTLNVAATGSTPFRYQWTFNGVNLAGATNATYTRANAQATNSGVYRVLVSNGVGSALSDPAVVEVTVPPTLTIAASDPSASEFDGNPGAFTVTRTGSLISPLAVSFSVGGSAVAGFDYFALSSPVTIPAGSFTATIPVTVIDDLALEGNETVSVTLLATASYGVASPSNAVVTIVDNDNLPPNVMLTTPSDGLLVTAPTNIILSALATDPDGSVARVEFFDNGTNRIGQSTTLPYGITWTNGQPGVHTLTAVATDNLGSTGISPPVTIEINAAPQVTLTSPSDGAIISIGANVTVSANASDNDGTVTRVDFYLGTNLLGSDQSSPYSVVWLDAPEGTYVLTARASDDRGGVGVSAPANVIVGTPAPAFGDYFINRGLVTGFTNTVLGTNTTFTRESGEPKHDNRNGNHSGWMSWTAPASGQCVMDTVGSSFDTVLAIYTGTSVSNLVKVTSNDDADIDTVQSRVSFSAVAGTTYQIAVDGYATNAYGTIVFHMRIPNPYPVITNQPISQIVTQGNNVSFTVGATGPGPFTYQWRFNGNNITGGGATTPTLNRNNVQAQNQGTYTVVVGNSSGSVTSAPALLTVRTPPIIQTQPASLSVFPGDNVVFFVRATGFEPFTYQWSFNGAPIPGATASNLVMNAVQGRNEGLYSVRISNVLGTTNSRSATLTVNDGLVTVVFEPLLTFTNEWRYHALGEDLGTAWRFPGYDDSTWSNGVALFGLEDPGVYPLDIETPFSLRTPLNVFIVTYYFRSAFSLSNKTAISGLFVEGFVDDGAVWYVNGREAGRLRIAGNPPVDGVTNSVLGQSPNSEGQISALVLPVTNAVSGQNLLSVEVHQSSIGSTDVVFGMALTAYNFVTNQPSLFLPGTLPNGGVPLTLTGISGRNYAIDFSTNFVNWSTLTTFTNFTGVEEFIDAPPPGSDHRFYRGRLAP
jgi:hypothetical protein